MLLQDLLRSVSHQSVGKQLKHIKLQTGKLCHSLPAAFKEQQWALCKMPRLGVRHTDV